MKALLLKILPYAIKVAQRKSDSLIAAQEFEAGAEIKALGFRLEYMLEGFLDDPDLPVRYEFIAEDLRMVAEICIKAGKAKEYARFNPALWAGNDAVKRLAEATAVVTVARDLALHQCENLMFSARQQEADQYWKLAQEVKTFYFCTLNNESTPTEREWIDKALVMLCTAYLADITGHNDPMPARHRMLQAAN